MHYSNALGMLKSSQDLWKSCEKHLPVDTQIFRIVFIVQLRHMKTKIRDILNSIYKKKKEPLFRVASV